MTLGLRMGGKVNCWEVMACGREPGGAHVDDLGVCPAAALGSPDRGNGGTAGGRVCWAVAGTVCNGTVQGSFAEKLGSCISCRFFTQVCEEEGSAFQLFPTDHPEIAVDQVFALLSVVDELEAEVTVVDVENHEILFANSHARRLRGSALLGRSCFEVLRGRSAPCDDCKMPALFVDGRPGPALSREVEDPETGRWNLCIGKALRWHNGRTARLGVAIDVTDRKRAEEFREQYLGLVSHDLRNPLGAIALRTLAVERSLERKGLREEAKTLAPILDDVHRMDRLIEDLLETSRLEAGKIELHPRPLELGRLVAAGVAHLAPEEAGRVRLLAWRDPIDVRADPDRLYRVLDNLLSNALKFSGVKPVTVAVHRAGTEAVVTVSDEGPGVAPGELPRLFRRFFRAESRRHVEGHGLGLYNARLIVEAHGGRIWAESEAGRGARFHFALPLGERGAEDEP